MPGRIGQVGIAPAARTLTMPLHYIDAADDPRLEPYRAVRERDLVGREGRFVAEGEVVLRMLVSQSRFAVESVLLSDAQAGRLGTLLDEIEPGVPIYVAPRRVMDGVAGFPIHRGILAIGLKGQAVAPDRLLAQCDGPTIVIGLVGLSNHDNVGGVFRNAAGFGAAGVLLDDTSCDPLYRKAIRVSVGATLRVPFARAGSADDLVADLVEAGFEVVALSPGGTERLCRRAWHPRTALLLGAEGPGLPTALLERVRSVSIPIAAGFDSLNVATTSGIALYEARRNMPQAT